MSEAIYTVYKHTAPNGKVYIGITSQTDLNRRWQNGYGYKSQVLFYRAIKKYGWENITHEVLRSGLTKDDAEREEIKQIAAYNSTNENHGYNCENGGNCTGTHSEETKRKISEAQIGNKNHMFGRSVKGRKMSPEAVEKNRLSHIGQVPYNKGKKMSDEQREKLKKPKSPEQIEKMRERASKQVLCVETGTIYRSGAEAAILHGLNRSSITRACGNDNKTVVGYHWKYLNEG